MEYNTNFYPGCTNDPDWESNVDNTEERLDKMNDRIYDTLESSADNVFSTVLDWANEEKIAQTLKAMIVAYENSKTAVRKADREQSAQDFIVFAKSFSSVCLTAIENEAEHHAGL